VAPLAAPVDPEGEEGDVLLPLLTWTAELWGMASTELASPSPRAKVILENFISVSGIKSVEVGQLAIKSKTTGWKRGRVMMRWKGFIHGLLRSCYSVLGVLWLEDVDFNMWFWYAC